MTTANILFVCRHNAVRSQIAAALTDKISHGKVTTDSAGPEPTSVPDYISQWVDNLLGDSRELQSQSLEAVAEKQFDMIITLCDKTHAALPELASDTQHIRWDFHHPDDQNALNHLEIELAERIRLLLLAKGLI